jgi:site-specific recombinase XerD
LEEAPSVQLLGKGRRTRTCPLWSRTVAALRAWLACRNDPDSSAPLFLNSCGRRLTRSGVAYVLSRAAKAAGLLNPKHARRLTPHVMRHSTAMHLLQAGADLAVVATWLGHAHISTTHGYLAIDLRTRREALAAEHLLPELRQGAFPPPDVLAWLDQLGKRPRYVESSPQRVPASQPLPSRPSRSHITHRCT